MTKNLLTFSVLFLLIALTLAPVAVFVTPGMGPYFLFVLPVSLLSLLMGVCLLRYRRPIAIRYPLPVVLVVLLALYYLLQNLLVTSTGLNMRHALLIAACFFLITGPVAFSYFKPDFRVVCRAILSVAVVESFVCWLQQGGIMASENHFFAVTGTWENPNVTAMFLAMALPAALFLLLKGDKSSRRLTAFAVGMLLSALLLLKCRTAIIGAVAAAIVLLNDHYRLWERLNTKRTLLFKAMLLTGILIAAGVASYYTYTFKQASADGRAFIWKLSAQMVAKKPLTGYGYGMFEHSYNLYESAWFKNGAASEKDKASSGHVYMAYNEFVESAVEGGIPGLLIFAALMLSLLRPPGARGEGLIAARVAYAGIIAFSVMSLLNFTLQAIPALCVFLLYASVYCSLFSPARNKKTVAAYATVYPSILHKRVFIYCLAIACCCFFCWQACLAWAGLQHKKALLAIKRADYARADELLQPIKGILSNSGDYWHNCGRLLLREKKYQAATGFFNKAKEFISDPDLYLQTGYCYQRTGQLGLAAKEYECAAGIQQDWLAPRYALMKLYFIEGDSVNAGKAASALIEMQPKTESAKAVFYKKEAVKLLKRINDQTDN